MNYTLKNFLIGCCVGIGITLIFSIFAWLTGIGRGFLTSMIMFLVYVGIVWLSPFGDNEYAALLVMIILLLISFGLWGVFVGIISKNIKELLKKN